jgi:hypothetical protein
MVKGYSLILTKIGLGYILGDFVTNSSGHPDRWQPLGQNSLGLNIFDLNILNNPTH